MKKPVLFRRIYLLCLFAFFAYALADTFIIPRAEIVVAPEETPMPTATAMPQATSIPAAGHAGRDTVTILTESDEARPAVSLQTYRYLDTDVHVAEITVPDISYIKTAFAQDTYGRNITETVHETAQKNNALIAINGDFYGARRSGYVIRNGRLYRSVRSGSEDLCIWKDGSFSIINENDYTAQELLDKGAWQVFSFGPGLVKNGLADVGENDEVAQSRASNPRTAIGIKADGTILFIVSDGRTNASRGLTLYELAGFLMECGAVNAYNLDGGGSSTLYYQGEIINFPTTTGRYSERAVSDIVYIAN